MMPVKLREWRQYKGVTQVELAQRAGVSRAAIAVLEQPGGRSKARPSTRQKLAKALGIEPSDLLYPPPGFEDLTAKP
jgi:transcriptional regulator with XRE-family HTH domain